MVVENIATIMSIIELFKDELLLVSLHNFGPCHSRVLVEPFRGDKKTLNNTEEGNDK